MSKYKSCFVPGCMNTTVSCPGKIFLSVPTNPVDRKRWLKVVNREEKSPFSPKTKLFCCEDHFELEKDMVSWRKYNFLKEGGLRTQALLKPGVLPKYRLNSTAPDLSGMSEEIKVEVDLPPQDFDVPLPFVDYNFTCKEEPLDIKEEIVDIKEEFPKVKCDVGVQAKLTFCSVGVQADLDSDKVDSCTQVEDDYDSSSSLEKRSDKSCWQVPYDEDMKEKSLSLTMRRIKKNPGLYIGISPKYLGFINSISESSGCSPGNVLLTLNKLKLNSDFQQLGDDFGLTARQATLIFRDTLSKLSENMKESIRWPDVLRKRKLSLPGDAVSIVECLEIKIEKPRQQRLQALTWSTYYHVNTCKYLVSCSPDGVFNFVSRGYAARAIDSNIAVDSGFIDHLPPGVKIMAFGGFKNLEPFLVDKQIEIVKPPQVKSGKLSKEEKKEAKRNVRLIYDAGRLVARIRTFNFLALNSFVDNKLLTLLDSAVIVVSGLLNQDEPLIL